MGSAPQDPAWLRVHWQFDALRIILYDQHPAHEAGERSEGCRERRSPSMWLMAAAVDAHGGAWGLAPALIPSGGSKSWA
ncbi:hypothetical protein [Streptomyces sp. NPDC055749]